MVEFTFWQILRNLLLATRLTLALSLVAFVGGGLLGIVVLFLKTSRWPWVRALASGFISIFQSTPLLMQIFLAFFGLALLGVDVTPWLAAGSALILWSAAFLAEIWRGCVEAVPKGQWEASSSLALRYVHQMRYIILPQAVRLAIPPTVGFTVQLVKSTSLASIIGFMDLAKVGVIITNATLEPLTVFTCTTTIYFLLCWSLSRASRALERRLHAVHSDR